jgi:thiamine-monophosphate kinase
VTQGLPRPGAFRLAAGNEDEHLRRALAAFRGVRGPLLGPGHDCAVVDVGGGPVVVTTDVLVDGVHFDLATAGGAAAGGKALLVNLSDLAAAAAVPAAFEVGAVLPRGSAPDLGERIAEGLAAVAARYDCPCAGGDTNVGPGPLVLAVTVLGRPGPGGVVTRAGARPGDLLSVTGPLGGSRAGRHLAPVPRLREAAALASLGVPRAMMDLSDGLSRDLPRLCGASGVGAVIDAAAVPVHGDVYRCRDGRSPLEHALDDGEDFELLLAHAPLGEETRARLAAAGVRLFEIGRVTLPEQGLRLARGEDSVALLPRGYDHFA